MGDPADAAQARWAPTKAAAAAEPMPAAPGAAQIAARLRWGRAQLGLSVQAAAAALGVHRPTLQRWETGKSEPSPTELERAAELYGVAPCWLAFGHGSPRNTDGNVKK